MGAKEQVLSADGGVQCVAHVAAYECAGVGGNFHFYVNQYALWNREIRER